MSQALHHDDYLVAEGLILARLEAQLADLSGLKVLSAADLAGVTEGAQHTPALHVIYMGDAVPGGEQVDQGNYHVLRQRWMVVVAVRNARQQRTGQAAREAAGPLLSRAIQALSGWRPGQGLGPLARVSAPAPAFTPGGFGYFPLQFETVLMTRAPSVD
ncbi:hypothetical protein [Halomonas sp.]|uniref:phage tail terminator protein n=1 Tax=Halomonas sp. TaxID=1486246 RepID=UPI00298E17EE|nr:hypothetical protein [Halomonas sp.]MDW7746584.1 hypothetical protein [Halomonas sp.]